MSKEERDKEDSQRTIHKIISNLLIYNSTFPKNFMKKIDKYVMTLNHQYGVITKSEDDRLSETSITDLIVGQIFNLERVDNYSSFLLIDIENFLKLHPDEIDIFYPEFIKIRKDYELISKSCKLSNVDIGDFDKYPQIIDNSFYLKELNNSYQKLLENYSNILHKYNSKFKDLL